MRVRIANLGQHGVILDRKDFELPQNAFSAGKNIEFHDGHARKADGAAVLESGLYLRPEWLMPYVDPATGNFYWIICGIDDAGDAHIMTWDGTDQVLRSRLGTYHNNIIFTGTPGQVYSGAGHGLTDGDIIQCTLGTVDTPAGQYIINYIDPNYFDVGLSESTGGSWGWYAFDDPYAQIGGTPWSGGVLNGLAFVNSGNDTPQKWDRTAGILDGQFEDFANWPAGDVARIMRPFRNFIVALDVTKSGALRNPYMVRWSDAADPFTEPSAWDAAPGNLAGEVTLSDEGGYIVDASTLRGQFIIYRQYQTYVMRYVGGSSVMAIDQLFSEFGLLAPRCAKAFGDGNHFVVSAGDIFVHNGNTAQSICTGSIKHAIFAEIDQDNYRNSFVVPNYPKEEMWFCYPTTGNSIPNKVARWNWVLNTWSFNEMDGLAHIGYGVIPSSGTGLTWDSDGATWDSDSTTWDEGNANPSVSELLIAFRDMSNAPTSDTEANSKLLLGESGNTYNDANMVVSLERTGLSGVSGSGGAGEDPTIDKDIQAIWPKVTGGPVNISVGASDLAGGPYSWDGPQSFDPATDEKLDVRVSGKFYGYRVESFADLSWELDEVVFELEAEGER